MATAGECLWVAGHPSLAASELRRTQNWRAPPARLPNQALSRSDRLGRGDPLLAASETAPTPPHLATATGTAPSPTGISGLHHL
ncbi:Leukotriene A-4 hydrolase-like protein [Zea mays]|uniref:Leukotriene A-4 hydrolase-like protein n=1 Tax=Zea mays TaxID=4577 RepID=A0A1D6FVW4_MAIZE|nr:Leukotriene A-4 hydrolase-like protein [Zea mays]